MENDPFIGTWETVRNNKPVKNQTKSWFILSCIKSVRKRKRFFESNKLFSLQIILILRIISCFILWFIFILITLSSPDLILFIIFTSSLFYLHQLSWNRLKNRLKTSSSRCLVVGLEAPGVEYHWLRSACLKATLRLKKDVRRFWKCQFLLLIHFLLLLLFKKIVFWLLVWSWERNEDDDEEQMMKRAERGWGFFLLSAHSFIRTNILRWWSSSRVTNQVFFRSPRFSSSSSLKVCEGRRREEVQASSLW